MLKTNVIVPVSDVSLKPPYKPEKRRNIRKTKETFSENTFSKLQCFLFGLPDRSLQIPTETSLPSCCRLFQWLLRSGVGARARWDAAPAGGGELPGMSAGVVAMPGRPRR